MMSLILSCVQFHLIIILIENAEFSNCVNIEFDKYFENTEGHAFTGDDFLLPWDVSPEKIKEKFTQQYFRNNNSDKEWKLLREFPVVRFWDDLCYQAWHYRDHVNYGHIKCTGDTRPEKKTSPYRVVLLSDKKLQADLLMCACPKQSSHKKRILMTNHTHNFFLVRHNESQFFSLISRRHYVLLIHGFVSQIKFPFSTTVSPGNRHFFTEEALAEYNDYMKLHK